ncbi:MAG: glycoside hydrolase family 16 protein [Planctomycetota bacterium]
MNRILTFTVMSLFCLSVIEAEETSSFPEKLVWQDEFNGDSLDYSKWGVEQNAFGGGNNELQLYTDRKDNVRVENGCLVIEARKDAPNIMGTTRDYSSGRIRTRHRGDWKYGRIEVRAKMPKGDGMWPAIWMLPTDNKYGAWASSGEIDIMEMKGSVPNEVLGTLHYGGLWPKNQYSGDTYRLSEGTFSDDFHTFSVVWKEGQIDWFVDGEHYQTQTKWSSAGGEYPAPFDQRFHLVLNLAVGGHLVKPPNPADSFPKQMLVDYVRVYQ